MSVRIHKPWFRSPVVIYECPHCGSSLRSPVPEIGIEDYCPQCGGGFVVPGKEEYAAYVAVTVPADAPQTQPLEKSPEYHEALAELVIAAAENELKEKEVALCQNRIPPVELNEDWKKLTPKIQKRLIDLERDRKEYAKQWSWGMYRCATGEQAKCLDTYGKNNHGENATRDRLALEKFMEVCYLDLNGANNSNPEYARDRELLRLSPPWDRIRDAPLACCITDRIGDMSKADVKQLFLKVAERVQKEVGCPVKPTTAWNKLVKAMREDGNW